MLTLEELRLAWTCSAWRLPFQTSALLMKGGCSWRFSVGGGRLDSAFISGKRLQALQESHKDLAELLALSAGVYKVGRWVS